MEEHPQNGDSRWLVVFETLSRYLSLGIEPEALFSETVNDALVEEGFEQNLIDDVFEWLREASLTSEIPELLSLWQPISGATRVVTSMEEKCIPQRVRKQIERAKASGLLTLDLAEKITENMMTLEHMDMTESEKINFLYDVIKSNLPNHKFESLRKVLIGSSANNDFYC